MRSYLQIFVGAFLFLVFGDSALLKAENQETRSESMVCGGQWPMCLDGVNPGESLGSRVPVILIHGWNRKEVPGEPDLSVWGRLISHLEELGWFNQRYKLYYVSYYSNVQDIKSIGRTFRDLIDRMDMADSDFRQRPLILIGYSMGGLIARSFMQEHRLRGGSGQLGGERVLRLITLGTPHHGTPFANGPARDHKAGIFVRFLLQYIDHGLFNDFLSWANYNRFDLHWDNYDGLLDYQRYFENNLWLERLNGTGVFNGKIVAYGGAVTPLSNLSDCFGFSWECLAALMTHSLEIGQNDGVVPYDSALFYPCRGCATPHGFLHYSHDELVRGKGGDDPIFRYVADDLLNAETLPVPGFDSYADLGNPGDERFHNLRGWAETNPGILPYVENDRTSRRQELRASNSVELFIQQPRAPHQLTFRSEDGLCDDSFSVFVNGRPVYAYSHLADGRSIPNFPVHSVAVPGEFIPDSRVTIVFQNRAADACGRAAVYFVRLDSLASSQSCRYSFLPSRIETSSNPQTITVQVITGASCSWRAVTSQSWIRLRRSSGQGNGSLIFELTGNQCGVWARTGIISISGTTARLEVWQDGTDLDICP